MSEVIKKIVLSLGEKEVELTLKEAKQLLEALGEMFDRKVIVEERHVLHHNYPWLWSWYEAQPVTRPSVLPNTTLPLYTTWYGNDSNGARGVRTSFSDGTLQLSTSN